MKLIKIIAIMLMLFFSGVITPVFSQQLNHTWGFDTTGTAYNQTGSVNVDSIITTSIVFDLQDYYLTDFCPLFSDDSVVIINSHRLYYGTFWYRIDVENATDSSAVLIEAFPGFLEYYPGSGNRISAANIGYSTTATVLQDSSSYTTDDIQWTAVNVYISDTEGKILPPEFLRIDISWGTASNDSIDFRHDFVYPAVYEGYQSVRTTTNPGNAMKAQESLH